MPQNCSCEMNEYLKTTIEKLKTKNYAVLNIVIGNESCDLDSAISSLVYAAFLHWQHNKMQCRVCTRSKRTDDVKDDIFLPILNVSREDYDIKTEVAFCLRQHGFEDDNLIFKDDVNLPELLTTNPNITLVDHHVLSSMDTNLTPHVTEIIDHRPIDKSNWHYALDTRSTIEVVGSCATLVTQRIKDLSALFAADGDFFNANTVCCDMLYSTIILDTVNFSKEVNKATPHDEEIALFLESVLKIPDCGAERKLRLESLLSARNDVSSLSVAQLLRKDVKVLSDVLVPSFPLLVKDVISRPSALQSVSDALRLRGCSCAVLLGMELTAGLKRDAAVYCVDEGRRNRLCVFLEAWQPSFNLSELDNQLADKLDKKSVRYYTQLNLAASRKQYMPALNEFLVQK